MKRSEFYAMFITMIVLFTASMSWAVSYQPQVIQPTKIYKTNVLSTTNTANTYVTVVDTVTGTGILNEVRMISMASVTNEKFRIKITVDGAEYVLQGSAASNNSNYIEGYSVDNAATTAIPVESILQIPTNVFFKTSLKVEACLTAGNNSEFIARAVYTTE